MQEYMHRLNFIKQTELAKGNKQFQEWAKLATTLAPFHYHNAFFTLGFTKANTPRDDPDGPPANHKSQATAATRKVTGRGGDPKPSPGRRRGGGRPGGPLAGRLVSWADASLTQMPSAALSDLLLGPAPPPPPPL